MLLTKFESVFYYRKPSPSKHRSKKLNRLEKKSGQYSESFRTDRPSSRLVFCIVTTGYSQIYWRERDVFRRNFLGTRYLFWKYKFRASLRFKDAERIMSPRTQYYISVMELSFWRCVPYEHCRMLECFKLILTATYHC